MMGENISEVRQEMDNKNMKTGIMLGIITYILWGFFPIYWKLLDIYEPDVILANRIIWSCLFMVGYLFFTGKLRSFFSLCTTLLKDKQKMLYITLASIEISANWLIYIWAVHNNFVIQASLGYYMNPLLSIVLGVLFLKEALYPAQKVALLFASFGVLYLTISYGVFPWISIALALSFGLYGLFKKAVKLDSAYSLTVETLLLTPIALIYLFSFVGVDLGFAASTSWTDTGLLLISGIATAVPLLLFGYAVAYIPLSLAGILQYIAPTIMLILGVFLYDEPFTSAHFVTFTCIWIALILFVSSTLKVNKVRKFTN